MVSLKSLPILMVTRLVSSAWNGRPFYGLPLSFAINFSPVFIWLCIFKNAGLIPTEWRPPIHVRLAYDWDTAFFSLEYLPVWILISTAFAALWHMVLIKNFSNHHNVDTHPIFTSLKDLENNIECRVYDSSSSSSSEDNTLFDADDDDDSDSLFGNDELETALAADQNNHVIPINISKITRTHALQITPILFAAIWPVLNIDQFFAQPLSVPKDLTAWFFYVLGHITFPILTAVWLYVFQPQGAVKAFSFALGFQNIAGVCTHLLFPNAPPWFIHMYGPDAEADYEMPGYAAGLTRVDVALGTHMHSKGFHKSPIVFGAFPSLHSAMAFQVCLFIWYYARSKLLRAAGIAFVCIQWWATIYLDHHFRIDLIAGATYALISFSLMYPYIRKKEHEFLSARLRGDFTRGSTMGMRVFRGFKRAEKFFDPCR